MASRMSCFNRIRIALVTVLLHVNLPNAYMSHSRTFVKRDQSACNKKALRWSGLTQVVHRRFSTHARAGTEVIGGFEEAAESSPGIGIKAG